jgi:hypothetical protein
MTRITPTPYQRIDPASFPPRSAAETRRILLQGWDGNGDPEEYIEGKRKAWTERVKAGQCSV